VDCPKHVRRDEERLRTCWGVSQRKGNAMVGMNGTEPATTTFLRYSPDSGTGVALLCNAEGAQGLPELLEDILVATAQ